MPSPKRLRELRGFVENVAARTLPLLDPGERRTFLQDEVGRAFGFARVEILVRPEGAERFTTESTRVRDLLARVLGVLEGTHRPFLSSAVARELGVTALLGVLDATYAF